MCVKGTGVFMDHCEHISIVAVDCSRQKKQGMGIGFSIARTIVQAYKGRVWAENQPEGGGVFRLSMPFALP
jgi:signal transduction histidine kinase